MGSLEHTGQVSLNILLTLLCLLEYVAQGFELTPAVLSEKCGYTVQKNESRTSSNNECPYIVDISAFTEDGETLYMSSTTYIIKLYVNASNTDGFRGFKIQGRSATDDSPVGTFIYSTAEYQLQRDFHSEITYYNDKERISVSLIWISPPPETGAIRFRYTFVKDNSTFWAGLYTGPILEGVAVFKRDEGSGGGAVNILMPVMVTLSSEPATAAALTTSISPTPEMTMTATATTMNDMTSPSASTTPTMSATATSSASAMSTNTASPTVRVGSSSDDGLSAGAVVGIVVGLIAFFVIVAGVLAVIVSLWHYKNTKGTVTVTRIVPDNSPLVFEPAVEMTNISTGSYP